MRLIFPFSETIKMDEIAKRTKSDLKLRLRKTLLIILKNTSILPFRRYGNKYKCFYCNSTFYHVKDLRAHSVQERGNAKLTATVVKRISEMALVKLDVVDLICNLCSLNFERLDVLIDHLRECHGKKCSKDVLECLLEFKLSDEGLACLICKKQFEYFGPLLLHTHRAHKYRDIKCTICNKTFSTNSSLWRHTQCVHPQGKTRFSCGHCEKTFHAIHRRDDHEKRIHCLNKIKCSICSEILGSEYKRDTHMATVHNIWMNKFECATCTKVFRFKNQLVNHNKRVHLKEKNITCEICGHKFFDNHLLKLHSVKHSDERPFQCDICKKTFPRKRALDYHIRIHTNDKRHVCSVCGKAFIQIAGLKKHLSLHHKETTYKSV